MTKKNFHQLLNTLKVYWSMEFIPSDAISINQHCDDMIKIVEDNGWNVDDFIRRMMNDSEEN